MVRLMENDELDMDVDKYEERCQEYENYLTNHISNVQKAFEVCDKEKLKELTNLTDEDLEDLEYQISQHDDSKYESEEWDAYLDWFYPEDENAEKDEYAYDCAWIHHCHNNPHHFQYWLCFNDDGTAKPIDMPLNYIIEALCDWHSFSAQNPDSSAKKWWEEHRDVFNMTDKTKEWFDILTPLFETPLTNEEG